MKVLISGAYGFVGMNLSAYLVKQGITCWALDLNNQGGAYERFFSWDELDSIPWQDVDAVVHLAGKAHDTKNTSEPKAYFDVNLGLTKKLFLACKDRVQAFVFFSSVKACADTVEGILTEDVEPNPMTPYGQSKWQAEQFLEKEQSTTMVYRVRPAMIHGLGNKGNLNLLYGMATRGIPWPLGAFDNQRSFCSIENVCAVVRQLIIGNVVSGVYQVADDETLSVNTLIALIAESRKRTPSIIKVPADLIRFGARVGDILHLPLNSERLKKLTESYVVSNVKIKEALGWTEMPVSSRNGLMRTFESFKSN